MLCNGGLGSFTLYFVMIKLTASYFVMQEVPVVCFVIIVMCSYQYVFLFYSKVMKESVIAQFIPYSYVHTTWIYDGTILASTVLS